MIAITKKTFLALILVLFLAGLCQAAVFAVNWDSASNTCTVTFDGSTSFDGATNANTLWTKGGFLDTIIWTTPNFADTVKFQTGNATTSYPLAPTITMDTSKTGIIQLNSKYCFPYVLGTDVPDGAVATFHFRPKK